MFANVLNLIVIYVNRTENVRFFPQIHKLFSSLSYTRLQSLKVNQTKPKFRLYLLLLYFKKHFQLKPKN